LIAPIEETLASQPMEALPKPVKPCKPLTRDMLDRARDEGRA